VDQGIGRQLLDAARNHGRGCLRGMLASSDDPAAARRYRSAGFTLHPFMSLHGIVDRGAIPIVDRVREGTASDIDLMDSIDRRTRGAAHGADHAYLLSIYRLVVTDRSTGSGYVYVARDGTPELLAATNRRTAAALVWEALASAKPDSPVTIGHVTAANEWALDVGMAARLALAQRGYLGVSHLKPPTPYLPHRGFL
jgi:hypothetical protein